MRTGQRKTLVGLGFAAAVAGCSGPAPPASSDKADKVFDPETYEQPCIVAVATMSVDHTRWEGAEFIPHQQRLTAPAKEGQPETVACMAEIGDHIGQVNIRRHCDSNDPSDLMRAGCLEIVGYGDAPEPRQP